MPVMKVKLLTLILIANVLAVSLAQSHSKRTNLKPQPAYATAPRPNAVPEYGKFPLDFERNQGQTDPSVMFLARSSAQSLFLTPTEAVLRLENRARPQRERTLLGKRSLVPTPTPASAVLRMRFDGSNPQARMTGLEAKSNTSNYLDMTDESKNVTGVEHFGQVRYEGLYPGIDLVFYGNENTLEYDFVVAPHTDPAAIALSFAGADEIRAEPDGALALRMGTETVRLGAPVLYQQTAGERVAVNGKFRVGADRRVSFEIGNYDSSRELVIDPTLSYLSYLGGNSDDFARGVAVDSSGNCYVMGSTTSTNFPTTAGVLVPNDPDPSTSDIFVTKINPAGTAKIYSTYLGGPGTQVGNAMAVDAAGRVTLVGDTDQVDFDGDAFALRLNATGTSANTANGGYVTIFGGANDNVAEDVALDAAGNAYITGETASVGGNTFPASGGIQPTFATGFYDSYLIKLDNTGTRTYGTFLHLLIAGDYDEFGYGVGVDPSGNVYVAGSVFSYCTSCDNTSAFLIKFNPANNTFTYNAPFGGSGFDRANDLVVDSSGAVYVVGTTASTNFPLSATPLQGANGGAEDAFFSKFNANGSLAYSTYLGTGASQLGNAIALDTAGNVYIGGANAQNDPNYDAFALKLGKNGENYLLSTGYSYTFGGIDADAVNDIAVDAVGNAYLAGGTKSPDLPITGGVFQPTKGDNSTNLADAFVAKIAPAVTPVNHPVADFDGDGKSDVGVYRSSNFGWYTIKSSNNQTTSLAFGAAGDLIVPGDYDGDGKADQAVFRPNNGVWYLLRSTAGFTGIQFGANGDVPAAADYDGDGKTDLAVFRPTNGVWYILNSGNNTVRSQQFGASGDRPVIGDYDGDGKYDLAVFRPSSGAWYELNSTTGFVGLQFGSNTDLPAQADYDGDHKTDVAVFRRSNGVWYRINTSNNTLVQTQFGANSDQPAPGDYDGDGKADIAVYRPSIGTWYLLRSTAGLTGVQFGSSSDVAIEGAYIPPNPSGN